MLSSYLFNCLCRRAVSIGANLPDLLGKAYREDLYGTGGSAGVGAVDFIGGASTVSIPPGPLTVNFVLTYPLVSYHCQVPSRLDYVIGYNGPVVAFSRTETITLPETVQ